MNHIYKSIFNKALGVFTAVPEFASAHGKGSERTVVGRVAKGTVGFAASALAISIGLALSSNAMANVDTDVASGVLRIADPTGTNSIRMGSGTTLDDANKQWNSVSIGVDAGVNTASSVAIGYGAKAGKTDKFLGQGAVALGYNAQALGTSGIAIGEDSSTTNGHNSVAIGAYSKTENEKSISIGAFSTASGAQSIVMSNNYDTNSRGPVSVASGRRSQIYGAETTVSGEQSVSIGDTNTIASARTYALGNNINAAAGTDDSLAFGTRASVQGANTIAVGNTAQALTDDSISIGRDSKAGKVDKFDGKKSIAIGYASEAMGSNAIALGSNAATNNGHDSIAMGTYAKTNGEKTISIGAYNTAEGAQSIVIAGNYDASTGSNRSTTTAAARRAIVVGPESHATAEDAVAIGNKNTVASARTYALGNNINVAAGADDSLVFGTQANVGAVHSIAMGTTAAATGISSIALGKSAKATDQRTIAMGENALAGNEASMALGYNSSAKGSKQVSIGLGAGALKNATDAGAELATFVGHYAGADNASLTGNAQGVAVGVDAGRFGVAGIRNVAVGSNTGQTVNGNDNTSIGYNSGRSVEGSGNLSGGLNSGVFLKGNNNVALGSNAGNGTAAQALEVNSTTSIGNDAKALTNDSVAIGTGAKSGKVDRFSGERSVAIGAKAEALGTGGIAIGDNAATTDGHNSVAIGVYSKTQNEKAISIGAFNKATGVQSIVIAGNYDTKNSDGVSTATAARATVIGAETNVSGEQSVAIGDKNTVASARTYAIGNNINVAANTDDSLVFGTRAHTDFSRSIAMGVNASTLGQTGVAIGDNAVTNGVNQISIGHKAGDVTETDNKKTRRPNVGNFGVMIGHYAGAEYTADEVTPVNHQHGTVAVGTQAGRAGKDSWSNIALGNQAGRAVHGNDNIAIGVNSGSGKMTDKVESDGKDVSTVDEYLNVKHSISVGTMSAGKNNYSIAIGTQATAGNGQKEADGSTKNGYSVAIGTSANASALNSVALGAAASASHEYSVALGRDSKTSDIHTGDYTLNNSYTAAGLPNAANGTVSVGSAGKERQIQNVAAGVISATSTDAINGSQLYATNNYINNFAGDVKTKLGGNAALGNDGHLTMTNIGGTGENTVDDAIKNLKTAIDNKADTTASVTSENPADIKVEKEAPVGNTTNYKLSLGDDAKAKLAKAATALQTVEGDSNITATKDATDPTKVKLALNKNLTADSVTLGDTTTAEHVVLNKDGLTVGNLGPALSNSGIDMRGGQIGNLVGGAVKSGERTAVSAGMLYDVAQTVKDAIGGETLLDSDDPNNGLPAGRLTLSNVGETGENTIHDAIKSVNDKAKTAVQEVESENPTALSVKKDGTKVTLTPNFITSNLVNADGTVNAPVTADEGKLVSAKTVADALKANHFVVDTKGNTETGSEADAKVGSGNKVTFEAGNNLVAKQANTANGGATVKFSLKDDISLNSVTAGTGANQVVLGNDGVKVGGNTYINNDGLNANSKVISNVADGVNPNDAVNKGQLDAVKGVADSAVKSVDVANGEQNLVVDNTDPKNPKLSLKKDLTVDSVKAGDSTLNNDGLTIAGGPSVKKDGIDAGDKKITNVAAGDVAENSKDAVNGGQLHNVAKGVADVLGGDAAVDGNGKVTMTNIGETGKGNVNDAIKHVNDLAKNAADTAKKHTTVEQGDNIVVEESTNADGGKHYKVSTARDLNVDSVKAGDTTVNNDGVTIAGGPSVTKGGINAGGNTITNVADGVNPNDAVNKGQLDKVDTKVSNVAQNVVNVLGGDATVNGNGDITMTNIGETGKGNINDAIKSVNDLAKKAAAEKTSVKAKEGRSNVTVTEGVNAAGGHEYTVDVERSVTNAGSDYVTVTNNHDADSNTTTYTVDVSAKTKASLAKADSAVQGLTSKDGNLNFTKGANGNVEVSFNDNLNVKNVTTDRVQVANGPSMSKDGINAAGKAISNVANGNVAKDSKDAVNGGQLHETAQSVADVIGGGATVKDGKVVAGQNGIGNTGQNTVHGAIAAINQNTANNFNQIRGDLRKMDRDLRGGIAGALATAGLPQAFRPGKSMVAAAASTYRGQSGLAIGVSRISDNGKVILKVTGNTNSRGDFGGTIGAGYQW